MGNKNTVHTYTYINDAIPALYQLAIDATNNGEVFHLPTTSESITQLQLGELFAKRMSVEIKKVVEVKGLTLFIFTFFAPILKEFKEMMYQFQNAYIFNSNKILERYPQLRVTPYEEAIQRIVNT
jgi:nucleoside-diphosphate-sugar epimerase